MAKFLVDGVLIRRALALLGELWTIFGFALKTILKLTSNNSMPKKFKLKEGFSRIILASFRIYKATYFGADREVDHVPKNRLKPNYVKEQNVDPSRLRLPKTRHHHQIHLNHPN